jgi:prepilin-type N-terminal cleavage/methylation domain-containing protein
MKKGFTLVELLATISLIGLLLLIVYPKVLNIAQEKEKELDDSKKTLIYNAVLDYMNNNSNDFPQNESDIGKKYCFSIEMLDNENLIPVEIDDVLEQYNYVQIKIGLNRNHSYTLLNSKDKLDNYCQKVSN